jgi:aminopeptidase
MEDDMETPDQKFARLMVDYSTGVKPGERVAITSSTAAIPFLKELYRVVVARGAYPHILLDIPDQEEIFLANASDELLEYVPVFHKMAFEEFDVLLKVRAETNTRLLTHADPQRLRRRYSAVSTLIGAQFQRGATGALRWMSTIYPTQAYAMEAEQGFEEFRDFFFSACHTDDATPDPVAHWRQIKKDQQVYIDRLQGHDQVELHGPNVDLRLSIKDRKFMNACGQVNLPDGEVFTGPVEDSMNGWVRFTFPAASEGTLVEGIELHFEDGKVVKASAEKNQAHLMEMLDFDAGSRYVGEFAIGTNYQINRFSRNILLDEKFGGSFHLALGRGYPETGNHNESSIHWDLICDLRNDSEILVDHELVYKNGQFVF